jgi:hypothetical protein
MKMFENRPKLAALAAAPMMAVAVALAFGTLAGRAVAQNPSGGNSASMFAVGGFTTLTQHVDFAAQNNPKKPGTYAGHVVQDDSGVQRSGPVTCLTVSGTVARVQWRVTRSDNSTELNTLRQFDVMDNGQPMMGTGMSTDNYDDRGLCNQNIDCLVNCCNCPSSPMAPTGAILRGNIVVSP